MSHEQYKDEKIRNHGNRVLEQSFRLDFSARDVKYIIVREEKEVLKIAGKIKALGSRYSQEDIELLTTRIISMQRILEDF
jgi:hypothetical protein